MKQSIYLDSDDYRSVVNGLKHRFVRNVIARLEIPIEDYPEELNEVTVEDRRKLRDVLEKWQVEVLDDRDGGVKIYLDNSVIAEWKKPWYIFREDRSKVNPAKRIFIEAVLDYSTVWDEEDQNGRTEE